MAIIYTLRKRQDEQVLMVSQDTRYTLTYTSDGSSEVIATDTLLSGESVDLLIPKDGAYSITLSAPEESNVTETFNVIKYLQDSIATAAFTLLCNCSQAYENTDCKTRSEKEAIAARGLATKVFTFQTNYIPLYGENFSSDFASFLEQGGTLFTCKLQTSINNLLREECVTGCIGDTSKLFKLHIILYWAGMYFTERALINTSDAADLAFLKAKFYYDDIVGCICECCVKIDELEALYTIAPVVETVIYSFQFTDTNSGIADIATVDEAFLATNGLLHTEESLITGKDIAFTGIARLGFSIATTTEEPYQIFDVLNNDITTTVFDRQYDAARELVFYVTKNIVVPSTVFFKFTKN